MIIKSRAKLETLVFQNLPKYPLIEQNFKNAISHLFAVEPLSALLEINLIRYLATDEKPISNFEEYLSKKTFTNLNEPISRLKSNFKHEYYAVLAELETARRLNDEGMQQIRFLPHQGNPDIEYEDKNVKRYAEVKNLEDINPEFTILNNKLEAESLRNKNFKRSFMMECQYNIYEFDNIGKFYIKINLAVTLLIRELRKRFRSGNEVDENFTINEFVFKISTNKDGAGFLLVYHGSPFVYSSEKDSFLQFSSVYTRMINSFKKGYLQLSRARAEDKSLIPQDRLYIYLNLGQYNNFIPKEAKRIFNRIAKATGMKEMVDLKIIM